MAIAQLTREYVGEHSGRFAGQLPNLDKPEPKFQPQRRKERKEKAKKPLRSSRLCGENSWLLFKLLTG
jgi:hypothetical protein